MTLAYVGTPVVANPDLVYRDYVSLVKQQDLTQAQVDAAINAKLGGYASISYTDTKDGLLASQGYIDAQDNLRLRLSAKNVANGVPALDATGKVSTSFIYQATNDQKYNQGPWSPSAYNAGQVIATTTEQPLYTCGVTNPGFPYRLVIFGLADCRSNLDTEYPVIRVRVGSASGEIIAIGRGPSDAMENALFTDTFNRDAADMGSGWSETYTGPGEGFYAPNGTELVWTAQGNDNNGLRARRVNPFDQYTGTDYQRIMLHIGSVLSEDNVANTDPTVRLYGRMNDAETQYVSFEVGCTHAAFKYANNGEEIQLGSTASTHPTKNSPYILITGTPANPNTYYLYKEETLVMQVNDTGAVTARGPLNRGWGMGAKATESFFFSQANPAHISHVSVNDAVFNYGTAVIVPRRLDQMSILNGATTLYISVLRSGTVSQATVTPTFPKLHVCAVPA